ncbi:MAG: hypothetical protein M0R70_03615 [Nitrospirae bacterium]|nr:hypothetical protein [Nitrospirota bacterium]
MSGIMKKRYWLLVAAVVIVLPAIAFAQNPTTREYPYIYKSTRAMGMGGAYTAVGGRVDSLFYNPAGLINIPRDKGWEFNLINVSAEYGKNAKSMLNDFQDASDTADLNHDGKTDDDQLRATNDVLAKYRGKNLHLRVSDFTSLGKSYDRWAFGVGGIANGRLDAITHQGFGADGFLEVNADAVYGALGGVSYGVTNDIFVGLTIKSLHREALIHNFTARELVEKQDNLGDYIKDDLRVSGNAIGFDTGLIWKFAQDSPLKPSFGASIMNIGNMSFGPAGKIPQTVNVGVAINPALSAFRSLTVGADYIDVLNNFKQDKDFAKRLRIGAELQLFDIWPAELALRAGMYESSPTLGFDLRLLIFTVSYAMYTEEIGAYAGQDKDKRQLVTVNIGW